MVFCFTIITFSCMLDFHCKYLFWFNCCSVVLNQKYNVFKMVFNGIHHLVLDPLFFSYHTEALWVLFCPPSPPMSSGFSRYGHSTQLPFCLPSSKLTVNNVNSFAFLGRCLGQLKRVDYIT